MRTPEVESGKFDSGYVQHDTIRALAAKDLDFMTVYTEVHPLGFITTNNSSYISVNTVDSRSQLDKSRF